MTKIEEMMNFCNNNNIFWFCDLVNYASKNRGDWFRTLVTEKGSMIISSYLADKAYKAGMITDKQYTEWQD